MTSITGELSARIGELTKLDTLNRTFTYEQYVYPYIRNTKIMTGKLPRTIGNLKQMVYEPR